MPSVSVIMPAYNHAPFVRQAVESVLTQSFVDFELIVNDDASTDETASIVSSIRDPRVKLKVSATNQGASPQVNDGIRRSSGKYIAILNSDDYFLPQKLSEQVAFLEANPGVAAVFGMPFFVDENGAPLPPEKNPFRSLFINSNMPRRQWLNRFFCIGNALCHPTVMMRRSCYEQVGGYDERLGQLPDFDMWIRILMSNEIHILDKFLTAFRVLGGERNASGLNASGKQRHDWELQFVLRRYLDLSDEELQSVFEKEFCELDPAGQKSARVRLALLALKIGSSAWARSSYLTFGLRVLHEELEKGAAGITPSEYMKLTGEMDPFNIRFSAALNSLRGSRVWKVVAPLRRVSKNIKKSASALLSFRSGVSRR